MKRFLLLLLSCCCVMSAEVRYVQIKNEGRLWTESFGENWGDNAVIFVHGCGSHALVWNDYFLQPYIDCGYFVIRYDLRDIGLSSHWNNFYDVADLADDVATIMDSYGLERAHIVGHSMGGMVSQFVAQRHPDRVTTLTLMSTAPVAITPSLEKPMTWPEMVKTSKAGIYMLLPLPTKFEEGWPLYLTAMSFFNGGYPVDLEIAKEYARCFYERTIHPLGYGGALHHQLVNQLMVSLYDRPYFFQDIVAPTLILHGRDDPLILPNRGAEALYEAIQDSTIDIVPKMGHAFLNKELSDILNHKIISFMEAYGSYF